MCVLRFSPRSMTVVFSPIRGTISPLASTLTILSFHTGNNLCDLIVSVDRYNVSIFPALIQIKLDGIYPSTIFRTYGAGRMNMIIRVKAKN